ncbi:hypothetical protein FB451DRAFT_451775 [Mycena latifolia]|nr:hypothetical protein FB451DRAFT_451775 [Mycena latifolia]
MGTLQELLASSALVTIADWPDGAEAAVAAHILEHVPKWFASPDSLMRESAGYLLKKLVWYQSTARAVMDPKLCAQLVTILGLYPDNHLAFNALEALASIADWPNGAEAVVAAKALDHITNTLESRHYWVRQSTCNLLTALARHESTVQAVARSVPRERLVALSRDHYFDAAKVLQAIDDYLARAQAPTDEPGEPNVL